MTYPKRLIEVDLPIGRISAHSRREKSIRRGHISTLHIWWARRPLAACRAVICASLWPDPADPACPALFANAAQEQISKWAELVTQNKSLMQSVDPISFSRLTRLRSDPTFAANKKEVRRSLLDFIADFANWDNSANQQYLTMSRKLTQVAHEALGGASGTLPLVVDPFAGGGSIPLEALRIGADVFASDLNPIPVLLNKVVLELIPKYGARLAEEVRKAADLIRQEAERELGKFYPKDSDGSVPIAYIWSRTIKCEAPDCGTDIPLIRSPWLARKSSRVIVLSLIPSSNLRQVEFGIVRKEGEFWVEASNPRKRVAAPSLEGTVKRGSVTCPCCRYTTPVARVRAQLKKRRGGTNDSRLLCVVTTRKNEKGRHFRLPTDADMAALQAASDALLKMETQKIGQFSVIPDEEIDVREPRRIPLPMYGMTRWRDLFTHRQLLALSWFSSALNNLSPGTGDPQLDKAVQLVCALSVSKIADRNSSLCRWISQNQSPGYTFGRQALPMLWDFTESCPLESGGGWSGIISDTIETIQAQSAVVRVGSCRQASATDQWLPDDSADLFFTDPPYYFSIPYANLSDFFYVWLRRFLGRSWPELFSDPATNKPDEIIQNLRHSEVLHLQKDRDFYERKLTQAFEQAQRITKSDAIGAVVFAHSETEAWEALLAALIRANWCVTASWPIDTERGARILAQRQSTLASSVHLICRPRETHAGTVGGGGGDGDGDVGAWGDVLRDLPVRIHDWMPRLVEEGVVGADAIFACLGPALEIFSKYSRVEKANGDSVSLKEYLEHVWAVVASEALLTVLSDVDSGALEPDARLSVIWLWTMGAATADSIPAVDETEGEEEDAEDEEANSTELSKSGYILEYDAVRKLAQGLGAKLENLTNTIEVSGNKARLLSVSERTKFLFGKKDSETVTNKKVKKEKQISLFAELEEVAEAQDWDGKGAPITGITTLDRVHQAMLLFGAGRTEALKRFLVEEGVGKQVPFWKLAQSLSALYPGNSDEKRWVDGLLAKKKGFGFG